MKITPFEHWKNGQGLYIKPESEFETNYLKAMFEAAPYNELDDEDKSLHWASYEAAWSHNENAVKLVPKKPKKKRKTR